MRASGVKSLYIYVVACAIVLLGIFFALLSNFGRNNEVSGPIPLAEIIIARDQASRELGLGGRNSLASTTGMLFVFDQLERQGFWMKDMKFPIDIIWLDKNFRIVTVAADISPSSYPTIFYPKEKSAFALEVAAGISQKNNYFDGAVLDFIGDYIYTK